MITVNTGGIVTEDEHLPTTHSANDRLVDVIQLFQGSTSALRNTVTAIFDRSFFHVRIFSNTFLDLYTEMGFNGTN